MHLISMKPHVLHYCPHAQGHPLKIVAKQYSLSEAPKIPGYDHFTLILTTGIGAG